ncbi:GHMP kinase [Clostridium butyricum]|uniref:GHMP family kinase ATP-binding protein n=1 Tax=Clostridium butyricum TaxID=1492 RepID=UPI0013D2100A|nr:GHMP kinase [Clostridium butyricum]MCQ2022955.1 GHMP kinase [Clostridium butyricum]NFB70099.1 GHMP kinase [Clostridium butyricum]NFB89886.1 GHMP kinase [Clostridium butyricum]
MIISKTPLRISFFGGGTDLAEYYLQEKGMVVSTSIDKYIYITVNKRFDDTIRISYSKTEIVNSIDEIQHPIIKEAMKLVGIYKGIEITSIADIPAKTGLGSSSSFTVGLLNALYAYKGIFVDSETLARQSCEIEINILKEPIGKQDQYAAAYGGINHIQFNDDETVFVNPIICSKETKEYLNKNLLLFYTGITRSAGEVLNEQKTNTAKKMDNLNKMKLLTQEFQKVLIDGKNLSRIGHMLHESWILKRSLSNKISNNFIDETYDSALQNGAIGGKILGAGGGGFLLFYCEPHNHLKLINKLSNLEVIDFKFEPQGSKIIFVD